MSRRRASGDSSLELLLDTICNTFGGVLFLAMLVSLLLSQTRRKTDANADPAPAVSAADLVRLDTRAEDASTAVAALAEQVEQARRVAGDLSVPNAAELTAAADAAEKRAREAESRRTELLATLAAQQAATARAAAAKVADERERRRLAEEAERVRKRVDEALEERDTLVATAIKLRDDASRRATVRTTGQTPRMRKTTKTEFGLMIRYGRLYLMKKLRNGFQVVNEEDFTLTPGATLNQARAKPHGGVDLRAVEGRDAELRRRVADFPADEWYACLVVFPDSFEEYLTAKNWLVERGYECRLVPTEDSVTDRGAVDVDVQ